MSNNYNSIARFYDPLSRLVYQRSIIEAQVYLLQYISHNNHILIVGGGTGWILEEISKLNKQNLLVVYIEKSAAMIELSKKRNYKNIHVIFLNKAIENYNATETFDAIITPFLFDNFLKDKIEYIFKRLNVLLKQNGVWLYTDFVNKTNNKIWQKFLLKLMYLFFKITARIETQTLIDMQPYFSENYKMLSKQFYYKGFIQAIAYEKLSD